MAKRILPGAFGVTLSTMPSEPHGEYGTAQHTEPPQPDRASHVVPLRQGPVLGIIVHVRMRHAWLTGLTGIAILRAVFHPHVARGHDWGFHPAREPHDGGDDLP